MPLRAVVVAWVAAAGTSAPCQPEAGIRSPADREHGVAAIGMAAIGTTGAAIGVIIIIIIIMTSSSSAASAFRSGAGDILTAMAMATHTDMATVTATHTDTDTIITITAPRVTDMATGVGTGVTRWILFLVLSQAALSVLPAKRCRRFSWQRLIFPQQLRWKAPLFSRPLCTNCFDNPWRKSRSP